MSFEVTEYPPRTFSDKYQKYLAPHGILLPPNQVLKNKKLGDKAEDALKKAFKITVKKLKKMKSGCANCDKTEGTELKCNDCGVVRYCSIECKDARKTTHSIICKNLKDEAIDQVVECLPSPVPLGRDVLRGKGGLVGDWDSWFTRHTTLGDSIACVVPLISQWWGYTGLPNPGEAELDSSLRRIVSNVFSTVLTIGHCKYWFPHNQQQEKSDREFHIHLLGADEPEVGAVTSGIIQVSSRVLGQPIVVTLVAPDLTHHPVTFNWSPTAPYKVTPSVKAVAYPGLYHDFWREHIATEDKNSKVPQPDLALAIHPGVHTSDMLKLWTPTLQLLALQQIPLAMTTYNEAEFTETLEKLSPLGLKIVHSGINPLRSLHSKQTPYEPDHIWSANSYAIAIDNTRTKSTASNNI